MLTGKPLFPGKNVVHQLDLMTDLLGTPAAESTARVCCLILVIAALIFHYFRQKKSYSVSKLFLNIHRT